MSKCFIPVVPVVAVVGWGGYALVGFLPYQTRSRLAYIFLSHPRDTEGGLVEKAVLTSPLLLVVAGLVRDQAGRFLLSQRKANAHLGSLWEFPGGKIQVGETPEAALVREMREELGIEVLELTPWTFVSHDYSDFHVLMVLFHCGAFRGLPRPLDVQNVGWFTPKEMERLEFPPADQPLLKQLPL